MSSNYGKKRKNYYKNIQLRKTPRENTGRIASGSARSPRFAGFVSVGKLVSEGAARSLYIGERSEPTCIYTGYALLSNRLFYVKIQSQNYT